MKTFWLIMAIVALSLVASSQTICGDNNIEANASIDQADQFGWPDGIMACVLNGTQTVTDGYFHFSTSGGTSANMNLGLATISGGAPDTIVCQATTAIAPGFSGWAHVTFSGCTPSAGTYAMVWRSDYFGNLNYATGSGTHSWIKTTSCCTLINFVSPSNAGTNGGVSFYMTIASPSAVVPRHNGSVF